MNITVMRPFSLTCEIVSFPLPVRSSYHTLRSSTTWKQSYVPLGEQLTWPVGVSGAVATQKMCWARIQVRRWSGMVSK